MGGAAATVDRGTRREKITVPLSHPLILLRAQAPPADCIPAYAMGHTMRLDKIMIWISIHLHLLPRGHLSLSRSRPTDRASLPSPFHVSQSYARYHTNVLLVCRRRSFRRRRNATRTVGRTSRRTGYHQVGMMRAVRLR